VSDEDRSEPREPSASGAFYSFASPTLEYTKLTLPRRVAKRRTGYEYSVDLHSIKRGSGVLNNLGKPLAKSETEPL